MSLLLIGVTIIGGSYLATLHREKISSLLLTATSSFLNLVVIDNLFAAR